MKTTLLAVSAFAAFTAFATFSETAAAAPDGKTGLAACGDIDVSANATCTAEIEGGCTAKCTPVSFEAACEAKVNFTGCEIKCTAEASAECTGSCGGTCEAQCSAKPGEFSCQGNCEASCGGTCDTDCEAKAGDGKAKADCRASCKASCGGRCEGSCKSTPPTADCKAKCEGSCSGSCKTKANASCDYEKCHGSVVAQCTSELQGGCTTKCSEPKGALFCDGQYMDKGGNAEDCIAALKAQLNITVTYSASASGECKAGECKGAAEASAGCGTIAGTRSLGGEFVFGAGLLGLALGVSRSLRRRK